ncbi:MAG TPA: hypothetical protein VNM87_01590 [Candidatus Udaeobacter sp.]|nr:hypothetical protein [Candidatus Udaeobacter sp.]
MADPGPSWKATAEDSIRRLPGVVGVHIRMQGDQIGAVFVQTDGSRDSRRFVRDVEAILATTAGMELDYRKVSVAATPALPSEGRAGAGPQARLAFEHVKLETSGLQSRAQVELSLGDQHIVGMSEGPATRAGGLEIVGEACLAAASQFLADPVSFSLGGLERLRVGRDEVFVVLVRFVQGRSEKTLTGSSPGDQDDLRSVAYATLDALNRTFASLRVREPEEFVLQLGSEAQ